MKKENRLFAWKPSAHPENALEWLNECGFSNCENHYLNSVYESPLDEHIKKYIQYHLEHIYQKAVRFKLDDFQIPQQHMDEFYKITDINSAEYILNKPFYHCAVYALYAIGQKGYN